MTVDNLAVYNDEVSKDEIAFILKEKPLNIFCYPCNLVNAVTTWTGEPFGLITYKGHSYKSNFGDNRQSVQVNISGTCYHGIIYDGMYCRLKRSKAS